MTIIHVALTGNPNSGKTSVFNLLTGATQSVGNWPGVTVERKSGSYREDKQVMVQDLPGIYSLAPYTPEEIVARDYLVNGHPTVIVNVIDGMNLERNLYLTTQLIETGIPVVLALNMMDLVKKSGRTIHLAKLAYGLGVEVVGISAIKKQGMDALMKRTLKVVKTPPNKPHYPSYDPRIETALEEIIDVLGNTVCATQARWYALKLFERDEKVQAELALSSLQVKEIQEIIGITEQIFQDTSDAILVNERYEFITKLVALCMVEDKQHVVKVSDQIDRLVTHRLLSLPIFACVMWGIYYLAIQGIGGIGTDWLNDVLFGSIIPDFVQTTLVHWHIAEWLQDLIINGIIAGVGSVLGFLPQLIVLFLCLSLLEDCGYMSRIAFVMDRIFRKFGLSGKSFIPMLIATGCGVPGVMASRTIENEKDRRLTVMITTFMPCSAKLPIIALVAGAFFPHKSWVAPSAYFIGIAAIVLSGIALKKTRLFSGDPAPFIMELPAYHLPQLRSILNQTYLRAKSFIKKAGTIIFVSTIVIWFTFKYNFMLQEVAGDQSILATFGHVVALLFKPLGWGVWQGAVATITGLVAKENVIGSFGILYGHFGSVSENGQEVWSLLHADFTPVAAYSFLVFNLLCAPCFAAIGAIRREMGDLRWTLTAIGYQCGLAYAVSFVVYQFGHVLFEGGQLTIFTGIAGVIVSGMIYQIVHQPKQRMLELPTTITSVKEG